MDKNEKQIEKGCTYNSAALPISNAFCRLACPFGSCSLKPCSFAICSLGFPPISLTRTASPSLIPIIPSCEIGFCSKNSVTNSDVYRIVSKYLVGRRSFSDIADERSMISIRCRMMPRCRGVVSFNVLERNHGVSLYCANERASFYLRAYISPSWSAKTASHLFLCFACRASILICPCSSSGRFSQVRSTSRLKAPARLPRSEVRVLAPRVVWWGVASSDERS